MPPTIDQAQNDKRDVLDYGYVRLIDYMGEDISIVRAARVSHNAAWRAGQDKGSDARLIKYLWDHKHTTPFESVTFTFEIKAPIFVFRQWHRHRTWSYNEVSARYTELPSEFYVPRDIGVQSTTNKQGRAPDQRGDIDNAIIQGVIRDSAEASFAVYRRLLAQDVPRELARSVLPVNTYSHMFATVNLLNLFKFLTLRRDAHAQYEIRVYADALLELAQQVVPVAVEAFLNEDDV